jgi:cytidine deaminase
MKIASEDLIRMAKSVAKVHESSNDVSIGDVGCALVTDRGNVFLGSSIHANCGIGFCAEHSAIASMVTNGEFRIKQIVAVSSHGKIFPPCGRCRELMYQVNEKNIDASVIIGKKKLVKLRELLPSPWQKCKK